MNILYGLDEVRLTENEVNGFGFFDFDSLDVHGSSPDCGCDKFMIQQKREQTHAKLQVYVCSIPSKQAGLITALPGQFFSSRHFVCPAGWLGQAISSMAG